MQTEQISIQTIGTIKNIKEAQKISQAPAVLGAKKILEISTITVRLTATMPNCFKKSWHKFDPKEFMSILKSQAGKPTIGIRTSGIQHLARLLTSRRTGIL
jgi:hypothetical protein